MAKILLVGTSYSEHKGSAALMLSTIRNLEESMPDSEFFVCSSSPDLDRTKILQSNVHVISSSSKNSTLELLFGAAFVGLFNLRLPLFPITDFLRNIDVIVDISGDSYSSIYGKAPIISLGARVVSGKFLRKPFILYCQSIGPFIGFIDRFFARIFLKMATLTIVRENLTANHLRELGIDTATGADQAFLLEPYYSSSTILHFKDTFRPIIGINVSQHIDSMYALKGSTKSLTNEYRVLMTRFIDFLIERYGANVLLIPELRRQERNSYDDYYVSKKVASALKHKERVEIISGDCSPSELKALVGYCDILISPRFHLVIFALAQNIPSIAIAYSPKAYGIMRMVGQSDFVLSYEDMNLELLKKTIDKLWLNREVIKKNLQEKMKVVKAEAKHAAELVRLSIEA